jgi:phosphoglycerate dehydrogenase-like enzyme
MTIRVGLDAVVSEKLLKYFTREVQVIRIPEQPEGEIEVDFWFPAMSPSVVRRQWSHLKGVQVVQIPWAGVDSLRNVFPPGVIFCDAQGVHDIPTAEWAMAAILAMEKCLPFFVEQQRQSHWAVGQQANQNDAHPHTKIKNPPAPIREIADSTVLIVGYGSIGKAIEARLEPFGAKFLRVARHARAGVDAVSRLEELLGQADIVVLTLPLTSETRHLMNAQRLGTMKPGALLVNAARGPIVDTDALLQALNENRIRAAIDVTDPEPLPSDHPLWKAPNLLITPHVAGDSVRFMQRAFQLAGEQAARYARGEPLRNVVTGEY